MLANILRAMTYFYEKCEKELTSKLHTITAILLKLRSCLDLRVSVSNLISFWKYPDQLIHNISTLTVSNTFVFFRSEAIMMQ